MKPSPANSDSNSPHHVGKWRPTWWIALLVVTVAPAAVLLSQQTATGRSRTLRQVPGTGCASSSGTQQFEPGPKFPERPGVAQFPGLPVSCEACLDGNSAFSTWVNNVTMVEDTLTDWPADAQGDTRSRFDFDCLDWHPWEYYHKLMDCLVHVSGLLHPLVASKGVKYVHVGKAVAPFWHWFDAALRTTGTSFTMVTDAGAPPEVDASVRINLTSRFHNVVPLRFTKRSCKPCVRDVAYQAVSINSGSACDTIVLVSRQVNRRRILDEDALFERLGAVVNTGAHAAKYAVRAFGNETVDAMVRLFARACVVVGYHGAGLANTLFNPPGSMVVEVTTYGAPYYSAPFGKQHPWRAQAVHMGIWRTNNDVVQHMGTRTVPVHVDWVIYMIELDHLRSRLPIPPANASWSAWSDYILDANAQLGRQHIDNIGVRVEDFLMSKARAQ